MTIFPTLFYTSARQIPTLSYTFMLKEVLLFVRTLPTPHPPPPRGKEVAALASNNKPSKQWNEPIRGKKANQSYEELAKRPPVCLHRVSKNKLGLINWDLLDEKDAFLHSLLTIKTPYCNLTDE